MYHQLPEVKTLSGGEREIPMPSPRPNPGQRGYVTVNVSPEARAALKEAAAKIGCTYSEVMRLGVHKLLNDPDFRAAVATRSLARQAIEEPTT